MSDPVTFSVVVLDGDTEISTMNMLHQVMQHMTSYESLRETERHRIAAWFANRFGAASPPALNQVGGSNG